MGQYNEAVRLEGVNEAMEYTVVIEKSPNNFAAYVPDLPGCVATGSTREELLDEIREAIVFHIESLREHGEPVPEPQTTAAVVDADALATG
jgi:predicted RNase H-like HicB family nuclease